MDLEIKTAIVAKGLEMIRADGEIINLTPHRYRLQWAVVNLGAIGMVTKVTLAIQPTFQIQLEIFEHLPLTEATEHFDKIYSSGYSVSFFTDWSEDKINRGGSNGDWKETYHSNPSMISMEPPRLHATCIRLP